MVQPTPDIASSSVPDLRARQPIFKVLIVVGVVAIAAAVVIAILAIRTGDNPGRAACGHIEELAQKDAKRWDRFVNALARTVVERAWNSADRKYVRIDVGPRNEMCEQSFEAIRETISYGKYETIANCVEKATTFMEGSHCFDGL